MGRTVLLRPGWFQIFGPGVFAVLTKKLLVNDVQQACHADQVRQKEFSGELWIFNARSAALRTAHRVAQDAFGAVPFPDPLARFLEIMFVDFKPDAGERL